MDFMKNILLSFNWLPNNGTELETKISLHIREIRRGSQHEPAVSLYFLNIRRCC